ncbi:hypothetical protein PHACT_08020 [Pseudohongiella acticola]|uniref:Adhesin domain-containing protein n=1 Tax=Pseudohongiella acticola TaxID=1524254 RepID=A0A1E8CKZ5_9GAMM|nr:hypothetical protein [Pseudohongiella acticola]OFE13088.1 hypothetical protein PHACT_08020 [Pseudohongiella acticola]
MRILLTGILPLALLSGTALAEECKDINFTLDSDDIRSLTLDVGAGYLGIIGSADDNAPIEVQARACADSRRRLDDMEILTERRGDTWELETVTPDQNFNVFSLFSGSFNAHIDIDLTVPAGLLLDIDDGSGNIDVRNFHGELLIDDGSGDLRIVDSSGPVRIDDGSGDIDISDVEGRIDVDDGSGSMTITGTRDVRVRDGSGDIRVRDTEGDVVIADDGSGDIRIERVSGNVRIDDDGSGDITVRDVQGDFGARDTGSGGIDYRDIGGRIDVQD